MDCAAAVAALLVHGVASLELDRETRVSSELVRLLPAAWIHFLNEKQSKCSLAQYLLSQRPSACPNPSPYCNARPLPGQYLLATLGSSLNPVQAQVKATSAMLKKLSSPRRKSRHAAPSADGVKRAVLNGLDESADAGEPMLGKRSTPKAAAAKKSKTKIKGKEFRAEDLGHDEEATGTTLGSEDKMESKAVTAGETSSSPRKSLRRGFSRKQLFETAKSPDAKSLDAKSPDAKSPDAKSPSKRRSWKPTKREKKAAHAEKAGETKSHNKVGEDNNDVNVPEAGAEDGGENEDPPAGTKTPNPAEESPARKKTRWKMSVPEIKAPRGLRSPNARGLHTAAEANTHSPVLAAQAPKPEVVDSSPDKVAQSKEDEPTSKSSHKNQSNVLSPLRRRQLEPEGLQPEAPSPFVPVQDAPVLLPPKRMLQLDVPPAQQPEVHLIGEIVSGHGFRGTGGFLCKWHVEYGSMWHHIAGDQLGKTQMDFPSTAPWQANPDVVVWSHPIDLHFATSAFQGWPKLLLQVWQVDSKMTPHVMGYGFVPVPFAAGQHELWVSLWRPMGSAKEELEARLFDRTPELASDDALFSNAWSERCRLQTVATGKVLVHIGVLLRNFQAGVIAA